jgi:hypothetical protein
VPAPPFIPPAVIQNNPPPPGNQPPPANNPPANNPAPQNPLPPANNPPPQQNNPPQNPGLPPQQTGQPPTTIGNTDGNTSAGPAGGVTTANPPAPPFAPLQQPVATATPVIPRLPPASIGPDQQLQPPPPPPPSEYRPQIIAELPEIEDIPVSAEALGTNAALAVGLVLYLLFESSLFNATIKENSDLLHYQGQKLVGPLVAGVASFSSKLHSEHSLMTFLRAALVLAVSAFIYSFLDPSFGFNRHTGVLFFSLLMAVGITIYVYEGAQVIISEQRFGLNSMVQFFPAAIVFAILTVAISRISDLNPGLILGFVAGAVVLGPRAPEDDEAGQIVFLPMLALLVVSLLAWLLMAPARGWAEGGTFLSASVEAALALLFVAGIQGLLFNLIPVTFLDGLKLWRWSKVAWLTIAVPSAFIFFHVIVNREGTFASASGERGVQMLIGVCAVFWLLTVGLWLFFHLREQRQRAME